jgi:hypothetical protein
MVGPLTSKLTIFVIPSFFFLIFKTVIIPSLSILPIQTKLGTPQSEKTTLETTVSISKPTKSATLHKPAGIL